MNVSKENTKKTKINTFEEKKIKKRKKGRDMHTEGLTYVRTGKINISTENY